jgi:hypothetical protein
MDEYGVTEGVHYVESPEATLEIGVLGCIGIFNIRNILPK